MSDLWLSRAVVIIIVLIFQSFTNADIIDVAVQRWLRANNVRGAAVAFYDGSNPNNIISLSRGYGKLSAREDSGNITADTVFQLASVSKPFTASAVAKLLDLGIIPSIDQDICDVIPKSWSRSACRNPLYPNDRVTWRHIMSHRSSMMDDIPDVYLESEDRYVSAHFGPANFWNEDVFSYGNPTCPLTDVQNFYHTILTQDADASTTVGGGNIDWYREMKIENGGSWFKTIRPGGKLKYSNYAFGYLAALVEIAIAKNGRTPQSFEEFSQEHLFKVLGMGNTSWFLENVVNTNHARGTLYRRRTKSFTGVGDNCYIDYTSGQLYSSVNDMSKFLYSMLQYGVPDLWSKKVGDMVLSCISGTNNCGKGNPNKTGFAWFLLDNSMKKVTVFRNYNAMDVYDWTNGGYHDGSVYGISTVMIVLPASNTFVVALANTDSVNADDLALAVIRAARKRYG